MHEFWESLFQKEGTTWGFEPADSALMALDIFKTHGIDKILIPGFGYGRNAKLFLDSGFQVRGIEISKSAIDLAVSNGLSCHIYHGSVISMPFDDDVYGGIFCYALLHLLNTPERRTFLKCCFNQLISGGIMVFTVVSKKAEIYADCKELSKDRYQLKNGLKVFFYDTESIQREFKDFGLYEIIEIDEPIKYRSAETPLKCIMVFCKKK